MPSYLPGMTMSTPYGLVADVLVDPLQLDLELLGREADGAEDAEAARLADRGDHVAAVAEREDRELDAERLADLRAHDGLSFCGGHAAAVSLYSLLTICKIHRNMVSTGSSRQSARRRPRRAQSGSGRRRLAAADRRGELLRVAATLMTTHGVDGVQFADVAAAAGVTRPLVYRFFASRRALIMAVLEDYADDLTARFARGALRSSGSLDEVARVFVEATCDTIEDKGAGPWHLLDSKGPDPEVARLGQQILDRLMVPWRTRIAQRMGMSEREAATVARMVVAAGRAVLELWDSGALTREEAVRDTARGVSALLRAFGAPRNGGGRRPRPRRASGNGRAALR